MHLYIVNWNWSGSCGCLLRSKLFMPLMLWLLMGKTPHPLVKGRERSCLCTKIRVSLATTMSQHDSYHRSSIVVVPVRFKSHPRNPSPLYLAPPPKILSQRASSRRSRTFHPTTLRIQHLYPHPRLLPPRHTSRVLHPRSPKRMPSNPRILSPLHLPYSLTHYPLFSPAFQTRHPTPHHPRPFTHPLNTRAPSPRLARHTSPHKPRTPIPVHQPCSPLSHLAR